MYSTSPSSSSMASSSGRSSPEHSSQPPPSQPQRSNSFLLPQFFFGNSSSSNNHNSADATPHPVTSALLSQPPRRTSFGGALSSSGRFSALSAFGFTQGSTGFGTSPPASFVGAAELSRRSGSAVGSPASESSFSWFANPPAQQTSSSTSTGTSIDYSIPSRPPPPRSPSPPLPDTTTALSAPPRSQAPPPHPSSHNPSASQPARPLAALARHPTRGETTRCTQPQAQALTHLRPRTPARSYARTRPSRRRPSCCVRPHTRPSWLINNPPSIKPTVASPHPLPKAPGWREFPTERATSLPAAPLLLEALELVLEPQLAET